MSSEQDQSRVLAERIARRVSHGSADSRPSRIQAKTDIGEELSVMRASLEELQKRLARIESHVSRRGEDTVLIHDAASGARGEAQQTRQSAVAVRSPWLSGIYVPAAHPSQERFGVEEAAVSELVDFFEGEKKCELEPGGKPCDHCSMCSTRGF